LNKPSNSIFIISTNYKADTVPDSLTLAEQKLLKVAVEVVVVLLLLLLLLAIVSIFNLIARQR
jgi:hypothetical protein